MISPILDFQTALGRASAGGVRPHLVLGAGFSAGASTSMTADGVLSHLQRLPGFDSVRGLFVESRESTVEGLMAWLLYQWPPTPARAATLARLANFQESAIATAQREGAYGSDNLQMYRAGRFLGNFATIFSLNFDEFAYRAALRADENGWRANTDGFGPYRDAATGTLPYTGFFPTSRRYALCYPHGALFIRRHDTYGAEKITQDSTVFLNEALRQLSDEFRIMTLADICLFAHHKVNPLIVTAGTSEQKMAQIRENVYLLAMYKKLCSLEGPVFTYGWSMSKPDEHLVDALVRNRGVRDLYVGIYGEPQTPKNQEIIVGADIAAIFGRNGADDPLNVQFFSADSANVWGEPDLRFVRRPSVLQPLEQGLRRAGV